MKEAPDVLIIYRVIGGEEPIRGETETREQICAINLENLGLTPIPPTEKIYQLVEMHYEAGILYLVKGEKALVLPRRKRSLETVKKLLEFLKT